MKRKIKAILELQVNIIVILHHQLEDIQIFLFIGLKYEKQAIKYAQQSSECELTATKAERESQDMKKAEYMEGKIGEKYKGIISSVTKFGLFVQLENTIEGLVRFENLEDDYYIYNENDKSIYGKHLGKVFKLGDKVNIEVIGANKDLREIDFKITDEGK